MAISRKPQIKNGVESFILNAKDTKTTIEDSHQEQVLKQPDTKDENLKRQTYYVTKLQIEALACMEFEEGMGKSLIIRTALDEYIPEKYWAMAQERLKKND